MLKLVLYDLNIQWRSGYWTVYSVIGLLYIIVLLNIPLSVRADVAIWLIYMDTSVLGLTFVGALVLFERQQGVLQSISVTPLRLNIYILSKVFSLTILSSVVSSLIWIIPIMTLKGYPVIFTGVVLASVVFTIFGLGFSAGVVSFNQYLARIFLGSMIFSLPVIPFLLFQEMKWLIFFPTNSVLDLFLSISKGYFTFVQAADILLLIFWIFVMMKFAQRQFRKHNLFL